MYVGVFWCHSKKSDPTETSIAMRRYIIIQHPNLIKYGRREREREERERERERKKNHFVLKKKRKRHLLLYVESVNLN